MPYIPPPGQVPPSNIIEEPETPPPPTPAPRARRRRSGWTVRLTPLGFALLLVLNVVLLGGLAFGLNRLFGWTAAQATPVLSKTETAYFLGSLTDTWGHTWTADELDDANFRIRIINVASSNLRDFSLDYAGVRVTYH